MSSKKLFAPTALVLALALAGCADMSGIQPQAQQRDAASLGLTGTAPQASQVDAQWWRAMGDAQLNRLVDQAIAGNPNLRIAQARLARAQAVTEVANSAKLPQVNASLDATRQLYTENGLVPKPLAGTISENGTLRLSASWELDFFGKYQAALDGALGTARAAQADVDAARILLASNVVRNYGQLARINDQLAVATRTLAQREEQLRLVRDRVDAGLDTRLELKQSEGSLPEARQQVEALNEAASLSKNALAALVGQPGIAITPVTLASLKLLGAPAVLPADLLGQRADIAAARWRVEAAGYDIKNAKAQFYPNINLVAFAGLSTIGLGRLLDSNSSEWGIGPAIRLPIFEGGRLRANLRGKTSDYDAAVESYNAAVIDAVRDVADQLASSQSVARQQAQQRLAQDAAEAAYDISIQRYKAGLGNYLNVLAAENAVLAQRRLAVDLAARNLDSQVGLIRAVGGGYTPDTVTAAQK
ncbi:efflux transporter outer membrane subunit [uncultured Ramlibacter sp.]|uniref:efflux transporter outer membrane subunit n=1 Tax=uncultured Ramlibacter sp. TaxID=260755 RepID=UPI002635382E|nr:efflux transporter outer membrane subunit [uncultured Ramlibacter sp.]